MIAYKTSKNAKILFVGINPHPGSYRRGVPFSNNKMFWYLLNRAGLLDEVKAISRVTNYSSASTTQSSFRNTG